MSKAPTPPGERDRPVHTRGRSGTPPCPERPTLESGSRSAQSASAQPPTPSTHVVAAVIERRGRLLIGRRPDHKRYGGLWEFPGGKVEPGESHAEAVRRELREELSVELIAAGDVVFSRADPGSSFVIDFVPVTIEGEPQALEHSALAWVVPADLDAYDLAPSDRAFVEAGAWG